MHVCTHTEVWGQVMGASSLLPRGSKESNSDYQTWGQTTLPAKPIFGPQNKASHIMYAVHSICLRGCG